MWCAGTRSPLTRALGHAPSALRAVAQIRPARRRRGARVPPTLLRVRAPARTERRRAGPLLELDLTLPRRMEGAAGGVSGPESARAPRQPEQDRVEGADPATRGTGLRGRRPSALRRVQVQDLNTSPTLPYESDSFDVITNSLSVDYMTRPLELFKEMHRVLKPGGIACMAFTNRCFPTKVRQMNNHLNQIIPSTHAANRRQRSFRIPALPRTCRSCRYGRVPSTTSTTLRSSAHTSSTRPSGPTSGSPTSRRTDGWASAIR